MTYDLPCVQHIYLIFFVLKAKFEVLNGYEVSFFLNNVVLPIH